MFLYHILELQAFINFFFTEILYCLEIGDIEIGDIEIEMCFSNFRICSDSFESKKLIQVFQLSDLVMVFLFDCFYCILLGIDKRREK